MSDALAIAADTLVAGVHFPHGTAPEDVAWKVLAVNASDLAAMGARPLSAHLSVHAPPHDGAWLRRFVAALDAPARAFGLEVESLQTGAGPTEATATVIGEVPRALALRRSGAHPGDAVCVTGTLGDAGLALALWRVPRAVAGQDARWLRERLDRPTPRVAAGTALRGFASAAIDVSDGLAQDLGHLLAASGVGAEIDVERLPRSAAFAACATPAEMRALALGAGDDYELCFTVPGSRVDAAVQRLADAGCPARVIGRVVPGSGLRLGDGRGPLLEAPGGYEHFGAAAR